MKRSLLVSTVLVFLVSACATGQNDAVNRNTVERRLPTDAEVEQYNAQVEPKDRIVCRDEVPVGSNIPVRVCRLISDIDETSVFHRDQLRRALR